MSKFILGNGKFVLSGSKFVVQGSAPWEPPVPTGSELAITQAYSIFQSGSELIIQ